MGRTRAGDSVAARRYGRGAGGLEGRYALDGVAPLGGGCVDGGPSARGKHRALGRLAALAGLVALVGCEGGQGGGDLGDAPTGAVDGSASTGDGALAGSDGAPGPRDAGAGGGADLASTGSDLGPASTTYLLDTSSVLWGQHGQKLQDGAVTWHLCRDHFPSGSDVRGELEAAAALFNAVEGTAARLTLGEEGHRSVGQLFPAAPLVSRMDYVDTLASGYAGYPCHPMATDVQCSSWVMNTCSFGPNGWGKGGTRQLFNISANTNCYAHFGNAASSDHPSTHGVAHELGHGFGMIHTPNWPAADRGLISTMQGTLSVLSAYDVAFLRAKYPTSQSVSVTNLVASPKSRLPDGNGGYVSCHYDDFDGDAGALPKQLYPSGSAGLLFDCATRQPPKVVVSWFNVGTSATPQLQATLALRTADASKRLELKRWPIAAMPRESQDQWAGVLFIPIPPSGTLPVGQPLALEFVVDPEGRLAESSELDNSRVRTTTVVASQAACTVTQASPCAAVIP